ncbi:MAG TPA: NAD-dependent epimerase/dehydratase family protein [archaeon]|nr:NAD-dependent epimerase/dehydratase family protein [archaeon]
MKILVTGGAGFIGSNLVERLVADGHDVSVLDNFSLGTVGNLSGVDVEIIKGDIRDEKLVASATKGIDIVFNQAAASASPMFKTNLRDAVSVNVDGFINILNACRDNGVKKLVYASTSSIYGNLKPPVNEDSETPPLNFYASTKLINEHFAALFYREYGLDSVGFRYMSIYGPNEKSKGNFANLVSQFIWTMQKGQQPVIYGDGSQCREFTYIADVVQANILAMKKGRNDIFNIGTGKTTSLNQLVETINTSLGTKIKPKYVKNTVKNYISVQLSDISKARKVLGYSPKYDLEKGIKEIISSQRV